VYCAAPPGPRNATFREAIVAVGWKLHQELVWVKNAMVLGHSDYHYRHEPILYAFKPGSGRVGRGAHEGTRWYGDHSQTTVLEFDKPSRSEEHPTMKPVALVAATLRNSTRAGDPVLDPFSGSGSTLLACEQESRDCYGIEISPAYCDVIAKRWENATGKKATRVPRDG
jgi:DNA modification methylase